MRYFRLLLTTIAIVLITSGCGVRHHYKLPHPELFVNNHVPAFDQVVVAGHAQVLIVSNQHHYGIKVRGPKAYLAYDAYHVKNGTLYILPLSSARRVSKHWLIQVRLPRLHVLINKSYGSVNTEKLKSRHLVVEQLGSGPMYINGYGYNLERLFSDARGDVLMNHIVSEDTTVTVKSYGSVNLNGKIGLAELNSSGSGSVNMQYLTPAPLIIKDSGSGPINLVGDVDVRHIFYNRASGDINIEGTNSRNLAIDYKRGTGNLNILGKAYLSHFYYVGNGDINIFQAYSNALNMYVYGSGKINLSGKLNIRKIYYAGDAILNLLWVDSNNLTLFANGVGCSDIRIAGIVNQFNATLYGDTHLEAKYLRSDVAYIATGNKAFAEVWVKDALNAFAARSSNIYYYYESPFIAHYFAGAGAILPMHF